MSARSRLALAGLALLAPAALAACGGSSSAARPGQHAIEVRPGDELFARLASLRPGDHVTVHAGTYRTPGYVSLRWNGTAKAPITVSGAPGERPPVIVGPPDQNALNLAGSHFTLAGLEIRGGGHGVRLGSVSDATLTRLVVDRVGDVGISCNRPGHNCRRVTISRSRVSATGAQGTPGEGMYLGCQDTGCSFTRGRIVDNVVRDTGGSDGDGIELKPGATANLVRGNVVCRTPLPGLNVWGMRRGAGLNRVERNVVAETGPPGIEVHGRARLRRNQSLRSARHPAARACGRRPARGR